MSTSSAASSSQQQQRGKLSASPIASCSICGLSAPGYRTQLLRKKQHSPTHSASSSSSSVAGSNTGPTTSRCSSPANPGGSGSDGNLVHRQSVIAGQQELTCFQRLLDVGVTKQEQKPPTIPLRPGAVLTSSKKYDTKHFKAGPHFDHQDYQTSALTEFPCRSLPRCHCPTSLCQSPPSPGCPAAWKASTMSWRKSSSKTMERRKSSSPWRFPMADGRPSLHSSAAAAPAVWTPRPPQPLAGPAVALAYHRAPHRPALQDHTMAVLTPQMIYYMTEIKIVEAAHRCLSLPRHPNPTTAICSSVSRQRAVRRSKLSKR